MSSILSELYIGSYRPYHRPADPFSEYAKQAQTVSRLEETLLHRLPDELRASFQEYVSAADRLSFLGGEEEYAEGFRLGARLMIEALLSPRTTE